MSNANNGGGVMYRPKAASTRGNYPTTPSPIILDLNGDGVTTVNVDEGVYFDHGGDRFAEKTGWVSSEDALLTWDRNGNGIIDDGGELFGDNTELLCCSRNL